MSNNENISSNDQQEPNSEAVPFFVRYLEGQLEKLSEEEAESICGGNPIVFGPVTRKYPSDNEDGIAPPIAVTQKFPSDHEDGIAPPIAVTQKFPSDHEDGIGAITTQKFPSDSDE